MNHPRPDRNAAARRLEMPILDAPHGLLRMITAEGPEEPSGKAERFARRIAARIRRRTAPSRPAGADPAPGRRRGAGRGADVYVQLADRYWTVACSALTCSGPFLAR